MATYIEGIIWYLFLVDCIVYNILVWTKGKLHNKISHWISQHFPLSRIFAIYYLIIILWLGYALYRMNLLGF